MKLFLINLDRQPERLRRMEAIFSELDLAFTRVPAVDGRLLKEEEVSAWGALRPGETGCFRSHRECWRRVVEEDLPCAAIFEDDLHMGTGANLLFGDDGWVPHVADIVKVETKLYPVLVDKAVTATIGERRLQRLRSRHAGAGGYVVTRRGAETLLSMSGRFEAPVDQFIFNPDLSSAASLVTLQLVPAICIQDFVIKDRTRALGLGSDLHDERAPAKPKGLRKLWREVKRPAAQLLGYMGRSVRSLTSSQKWIKVRLSVTPRFGRRRLALD